MNKDQIKQKIIKALDELYKEDAFLIDEDLCERCIAHRFVLHLEKQNFGRGYFIDCEYNKSHLGKITESKIVSNPNGNYIDVVITKRNKNPQDDLICFELKKRSNYQNRDKDRENLEILTRGGTYCYDYGFYVIFGREREKTIVESYQRGEQKEIF